MATRPQMHPAPTTLREAQAERIARDFDSEAQRLEEEARRLRAIAFILRGGRKRPGRPRKTA